MPEDCFMRDTSHELLKLRGCGIMLCFLRWFMLYEIPLRPAEEKMRMN